MRRNNSMESKYIFPFDKVKKGNRIIVYGYGVVGREYVEQLRLNGEYMLVCVADKKSDVIYDESIKIISPEHISNENYDYIVIANRNARIANEIRIYLEGLDISPDKIIYHHVEISPIRIKRCEHTKDANINNVNYLFDVINNRKLIVIGNKRRLNDLKYVFDKYLNDYLLVEYSSNEDVNALELNKESFYVINDYSVDLVKNLQKHGLIENADYISVTSFAKVLDFPLNWKYARENILLVGDTYGSEIIDEICSYYGRDFVGKVIYLNNICDDVLSDLFEEMCPDKCNVLLVGDSVTRIEAILFEHGFRFYDNAIFLDWERDLPSEMFVRMFNTEPKKISLCMEPINKTMEVFLGGDCYSCCINWLNVPIGNIKYGSLSDIWNSSIGKLIHLSMCNHTFAFCDLDKCSKKMNEYSNAEILPIDAIVDEKDYSIVAQCYPREISVSIDPTCNLFCGSCRKEKVILDKCQRAEIINIGNKIQQDVMPNVKELKLAGNGEVFASKIYRDILYNNSYGEKKKLDLLTNGQLFTKDNFEPLKNLYSDIKLSVSIDAAKKETYENVRRGGKWSNIVDNMEYASFLRKEGYISKLQFNFVYSKINYLEMPEFIRWAKRLGVDSIYFSRILFMPGAMTESEYKSISLHDENGALKSEYEDFFRNDIFKEPIVNRLSIPNFL